MNKSHEQNVHVIDSLESHYFFSSNTFANQNITSIITFIQLRMARMSPAINKMLMTFWSHITFVLLIDFANQNTLVYLNENGAHVTLLVILEVY